MKSVKIKDLGNVITGHTPPTTQQDYFGDYIPFIKPTDMVEGQKYTYVTEECFSEKGYKKYQTSLLPKGATCVVCIGTLGTKLTITHCESFTNQSVNSIVPNKNYDSDYIYYLMKYNLPRIKNLNSGTASGREFVSKSIFEKLKVEVHDSLPIQQKIASILSTYDSLIENNTKRIKLLEQMAENLYKEWFVRFRFPGHENVGMENGLPKGWKVSRIKDFGRIETGKTPSMERPEYYGGEYLFVKTPDMHDSMFVFNTSETLSNEGNNCQKKKLLPINSIMVSCIGSGGVVAINAKQGHTNQQINSIILHDQKYLEWVYFTCKSLKSTIELFGATGATMTNLSKGKFENLKVVEPTKDLVIKFDFICNSLFEQIKNLSIQNQQLTRQRDLLLPRLVSGKLEVKG